MSKINHVYNIAGRNANRLTQRIKEEQVFLRLLKIDIILFVETAYKLKKYTVVNKPDRPE
jgi:hypothetical protein